MTRTSKTGGATRKRYSQEYKTESLSLAKRVGVKEAAKQLGLHESPRPRPLSRPRPGGLQALRGIGSAGAQYSRILGALLRKQEQESAPP
jgi:hypothetical protein